MVRRVSVSALFLAAFVAGCQAPLGPRDALRGHFANTDARLDVAGSKVVFTARCVRAEFGPIVLNVNREFTAESVSLTLTGTIIQSPGDKLSIQGHFVGNDLVLQLHIIRTQPPISDPYVITLSPGRSSDPLVCNA